MAKAEDVLAYMQVMDDRYDYPHKRFRMFKLFLKKNYPNLHQLYFVPAWIAAGFTVIWFTFLLTLPEVAMAILPYFVAYVVLMLINALICQYIGVSRLLDSGLIDKIDPENIP